MMIGNTYIKIFFLLCLLKFSYGYFITVDAHAEECFYEKVALGTKLGLTFEISEGGFLDIDVRIYGPEGKIVYKGERETSGKYTFAAHLPGTYKYCFSNRMSTMTPKVVMFDMEVGPQANVPKLNADSDEIRKEDDPHKFEEMVKELTLSLTGVKHEQEYMSVRDRIHRSINESTNSRVVLWSFFEAIVLVTMTIGQIFYLKRFFEVRRVV